MDCISINFQEMDCISINFREMDCVSISVREMDCVSIPAEEWQPVFPALISPRRPPSLDAAHWIPDDAISRSPLDGQIRGPCRPQEVAPSQADATPPYNRLQYLHRAIISPAGNWEEGPAPVGRGRDALNHYDVPSLRIHDEPPAGDPLGRCSVTGDVIDAFLGNLRPSW